MTDWQLANRIIVPALLTVMIAATVIAASGRQPNHEVLPDGARAGLDLWRRENCMACHAVYGLGGHIGPDLTNVYRRRGREYITAVLQQGAGAMPDLGLDRSEVDALAKYLQHIDGLGQYPLPKLVSPPFGPNSH